MNALRVYLLRRKARRLDRAIDEAWARVLAAGLADLGAVGTQDGVWPMPSRDPLPPA